MQESKVNNLLKPELIIEMVLRRRWWVIFPLMLSLLVGIILVIKLPKIYRAETTILVRPQRVPEDYVRSIVADDIQSRINTISQQILSRTNLESIIQNFGLLPKGKGSDIRLEDMVATLRSSIEVKVTKARRVANAFTIRFKGRDPEKVRDVTNALANSFINENLKIRETQALGTSDFLDSELIAMRTRLEEKEKTLRNFRSQYMGELPNQLETNLRILDRLQAQLSERENSLRDAKSRLSMAQSQLASININVGSDAQGPTTLEGMKSQLTNLLSKYTEKHPDVIRLKKQISDLESQPGTTSTPNTTSSQNVSATGPISAEVFALKQEIANTQSDIAQIKSQINAYERRVEATPKREQEFLAIQRDYQNIQASYSSLLNRKLEADIAVNMERKQKGEQFRVIDPARLPNRPFSPDMRKIFLLVIAAGIGIGGGLIFLLEFLNPSFRLPEDIETQLGFSVLATIPIIEDSKTLLIKRINLALTWSALVLTTILLFAFAAFSLKGVNSTLNFIRNVV